MLTHSDIETDIKNHNNKIPEDCAERGSNGIIKLEFKRAQKGKELLDTLANRQIKQAKVLLDQDLNPNSWRRTQDGRIKTLLSLIIRLCSEGVTQDKKVVLTKLLKHKDLDFSQIRSTPAIEENSELKQIIEQAITEQLTNAINGKDLDDVKKLVENNCFVNYTIIVAALQAASNPHESIINYLNEKFPAVAQDEEGRDLMVAWELQRSEIHERDQVLQLNNYCASLCTQNRDLNNKNTKLLEACMWGRKQIENVGIVYMISGFIFMGVSIIPGIEIRNLLVLAASTVLLIGSCYS